MRERGGGSSYQVIDDDGECVRVVVTGMVW